MSLPSFIPLKTILVSKNYIISKNTKTFKDIKNEILQRHTQVVHIYNLTQIKSFENKARRKTRPQSFELIQN